MSAITHQAGIFSQCQGNINRVSLGIEATLRGMSHVDPGYLQTKEGSSSQAVTESTTRMLCKNLDLGKEEAVLFIVAKQNLACSE